MAVEPREPLKVAYLNDPSLGQEALLQRIADSTRGRSPEHYTELFARMFVAYVNDGMPTDMTWTPQWAVLIGPKSWEAPELEAFQTRIDHHWARFLTLMPGSNR